jgi:hypothetical protein
MPRKRLQFYQIARVEEVPHNELSMRIALQAVSLDVLRDSKNAPDGTYIANLNELILPKRKKGTKFLATYTQVFQKEL